MDIIKQFEITLNVLQNGLFPLSLAFLDVDKFKDVNDNYGHTFGDEVLSTLAKLFLKHISENDYVGRYGGEEFLIIFNNTDINVAEKTLLHISDEFKAMMTDRIGVPISFSAGLIEIDAENAKAEGINALIDKADKLMYRAKAEGRDRIMLG